MNDLINKYSFKNNIFYQIILVIIICCVYAYSWNYPILNHWDDQVYILYNKHLTFSLSNIFYYLKKYYFNLYIPITMYSYMIDYSLWGLNSFGYHLQNIFWHIVTVLSLYHCFRLFKIKSWIAFFLCLIFAVHPQRVESVVWLSERKDVLCAAFYFLSIYCHIKKGNKNFSFFSFFFFILSILSKPMAISLPIVLLLYEFYRGSVISKQSTVSSEKKLEVCNQQCRGEVTPLRNEDWLSVTQNLKSKIQHSVAIRGYFLKLWPYFMVLLIFIPISIITQTDFNFTSVHISVYHKLYTFFYNNYWYIKETLFSSELNPLYPTITLFYSWIQVLVFYIACLIIAIILFYRKRNLFIYSILPLILCFIFSILPVVGLVKLGVADHADRYSYIPSAFIWFSLGLLLDKIMYSNDNQEKGLINKLQTSLFFKKTIIIILVLYSFILIFNNIQYQKHWKDELSIFYYSVTQKPYNFVALIYLIDMEFARKNFKQGFALNNILRTMPGLTLMADYNNAIIRYKIKDQMAFESMIKIEPRLKEGIKYKVIHTRYVRLLCSIVSGYELQGNIPKVLEYLNKILELAKISDFMRFTCLGLKSFYLKDYNKSIYWYEKALIIKPNNSYIINKLNHNKKLID